MTGRDHRAMEVTATLLNDRNHGRGREAPKGKDVWRPRYLDHDGHMSGTDISRVICSSSQPVSGVRPKGTSLCWVEAQCNEQQKDRVKWQMVPSRMDQSASPGDCKKICKSRGRLREECARGRTRHGPYSDLPVRLAVVV